MDITRRRCVLATLNTRTKLSLRNQPRDIVGSHEVLRHTHDGLVQRGLTVVISRVLRHVSCKLCHADLLRQVTLERRIQDLTLRRLQTVHHVRDGALQIVVAEVDQVLVDEVIVGNPVASGHQRRTVVALQPLLTVIRTLLVERQINGLVRLVIVVKANRIHLAEVVLGLVTRRGTKSLVVLHLPRSGFASARGPRPLTCAPLLVLVLRVEDPRFLPLVGLDDRRRHVGQEPRNRNQLVPELVEQIDQQTTNVGPIQILIRHDHHRPVAQVLHIRILFARRQANDLLQLRDLLGVLHLRVARVLHIEHLTLERVDTEELALLLAQTTQCHRLG